MAAPLVRSPNRLRHDARNALTAVRLAVQGLARTEALTPRGQERVRVAEAGLVKLEALLDDLDAETPPTP